MIVISWNHIHVNMREDNFSAQVCWIWNKPINFLSRMFFKCHFGQWSGCVCIDAWCFYIYFLPLNTRTHKCFKWLAACVRMRTCKRASVCAVCVLRKGEMCHTRKGNGWTNSKHCILCSICNIRISTVVDDNAIVGSLHSSRVKFYWHKYSIHKSTKCPMVISLPYRWPQIMCTTPTLTEKKMPPN